MPKTNRYKMTRRKRTLKRKNSKKHNNKQRGGDNYVWYSISGFNSLKPPESIMLNKPNKPYTAESLFLTWFTNENEPDLNNLFYGDTKFGLDYNIYEGEGTQDIPYKVELTRKAYGYDEQIDTSKGISRYSSIPLPLKYRRAFGKPIVSKSQKPKGSKSKSRKVVNQKPLDSN